MCRSSCPWSLWRHSNLKFYVASIKRKMDPSQGTKAAKPSSPAMGACTMPYYYQQLYQQQVEEQKQQLQNFWNEQYEEIQNTSNFKKHNLPLSRIKKIMKADEDVSMIAVEAPALLARACEMFILEMTHRSWAHAEENKRRTLQKNDIAAAITRTDLFDFLVDIEPREEGKELMFGAGLSLNPSDLHIQCYHAPKQEKEMEICTEIRDWAELIPDALGIIFNHLSLQEKLIVVPSVCKSWGRVVSSPDCWQEIDLEHWSRSCTCENLDRLLRMLILRSSGSFSKLAVHGLRADALFTFVADHAGSLQTLVIPENSISDGIVEQVANRLMNITTLDLSYSTKMSAKALEAFGKNCKNLTVLHYTNLTVPLDRTLDQDDEAFAISSTMPNLVRLEVPSLRLTDKGVIEILLQCKKLEVLNIDGCWNVTIEQELLKEKYPNVKVLHEQHDQVDDDNDYDYPYYDQYDPSSDGDSDFGYEYILDAYGLR